MTVADPRGKWILETKVSDQDIGHILSAQDELGERLRVAYVLVTDPSSRRFGQIEKVALTTETESGESPAVLVTVAIDADDVASARPGANVVAKVYCGRRPLGYVWFRGLIEAVRTRLLF